MIDAAQCRDNAAQADTERGALMFTALTEYTGETSPAVSGRTDVIVELAFRR